MNFTLVCYNTFKIYLVLNYKLLTGKSLINSQYCLLNFSEIINGILLFQVDTNICDDVATHTFGFKVYVEKKVKFNVFGPTKQWTLAYK